MEAGRKGHNSEGLEEDTSRGCRLFGYLVLAACENAAPEAGQCYGLHCLINHARFKSVVRYAGHVQVVLLGQKPPVVRGTSSRVSERAVTTSHCTRKGRRRCPMRPLEAELLSTLTCDLCQRNRIPSTLGRLPTILLFPLHLGAPNLWQGNFCPHSRQPGR